jgi:hypothetical protein
LTQNEGLDYRPSDILDLVADYGISPKHIALEANRAVWQNLPNKRWIISSIHD